MESPGKIELPSAFEHADIDHLVVLIADMLDRLMEHNDKIPLSPESLTRFHSRSPPTICVLDYLRRIVKYANMERTCLLITLHYIDQICARLPHFTLSSLTCHRFIIAATVVASKALCDAFCTNAHYAKVGGIRVGELNMLERELLAAIDWRLTSTREVLDAYYVNLVRTHSADAYTLAAPPRTEKPTSPELPSADSDMDSACSVSPQPGDVAMGDREIDRPGHKAAANGAHAFAQAGITAAALHLPDEAHTFEPSTVLISHATLSPKRSTGPTLEQNMAFAALRAPAPAPASTLAEPAAPSCTAFPAQTGNRSNSSSASTADSVRTPPEGSPVGGVVHAVAAPHRENVQKRTVEHAIGDAGSVVDDDVDYVCPRPRTRPRLDSVGAGGGGGGD
ncbi:cyclin-domain-containing protein [Phellopilus nigrolimitatus]|nr:cyclin-domain-containing protein [Phellopilus nigrolimitatus]